VLLYFHLSDFFHVVAAVFLVALTVKASEPPL